MRGQTENLGLVRGCGQPSISGAQGHRGQALMCQAEEETQERRSEALILWLSMYSLQNPAMSPLLASSRHPMRHSGPVAESPSDKRGL